MTNQKHFHGKYTKDNGCHLETDARVEEWDISICLDQYMVYAGDRRDPLKRQRFLHYQPEQILFGKPDFNSWYWNRKYYWDDEGLDGCSNYSISFHYIRPKGCYTLYYLTYRLKLYGIVRKFPPTANKTNFSEVAYILDQERLNKTLRGY